MGLLSDDPDSAQQTRDELFAWFIVAREGKRDGGLDGQEQVESRSPAEVINNGRQQNRAGKRAKVARNFRCVGRLPVVRVELLPVGLIDQLMENASHLWHVIEFEETNPL